MRVLRIAVALAALLGVGIVVRTEVPIAVEKATSGWLVFAVVLRGLATVSGGLRWWFILRALRSTGVGAPSAIALTLEGAWLSLGLPTSVGGDIWRVYSVRDRISISSAVTGALLDRILGAVILLGISAAAGLWRFRGVSLALLSLGVLAAGGAGLLWRASPRLRVSARPKLLALAQIRTRLGDCSAAGALAVLSGGALVASYLAVASALDLAVPLADLLWVTPLIQLARMAPLTPGGVGVGELAAALMLAQDLEPARAMLFAFLGFVTVVPTAALGGLLLLRRPGLGTSS